MSRKDFRVGYSPVVIHEKCPIFNHVYAFDYNIRTEVLHLLILKGYAYWIFLKYIEITS